jgi:NAD(P)-dependent dehydrogenase (short-subunit alcohol dehydrogenase family)
MRRQRRGLLIHVSSGIGRIVVPGFAAYAASNFALEALADAYRFELAPLGIDSVIVEPGIHRTPILERIFAPADQNRVAEYGSTAEAIKRVKSVFEEASSALETPGPEGVVEAFVRLVETQRANDRSGPCQRLPSSRFWSPTMHLLQR